MREGKNMKSGKDDGNFDWEEILTYIKAMVAIVLVMGPSCYFGIKGNNVAMGLAILAGSIAATFLNLDKFKYFKGGAFEAHLHTKIQNMEELMKPFLLFSFHQLTHSGRMGSGRDKLNDLFENICMMTKNFGLSYDQEIQAVRKEYLLYQASDLFRAIYNTKYSAPYDNCRECRNELDNLFSPNKDLHCPTPDALEKFFKERGITFEAAQAEAFKGYSDFVRKHPGLLGK
jgi:hypothetical protein